VFAGTSGALAANFVTDAVNTTADDIFQGGGSKDTLGIQQGRWLFTGSKPQGKDDITHAYAAAYTDPSNGHLLLYAGLDRFDKSGQSQPAAGEFLEEGVDLTALGLQGCFSSFLAETRSSQSPTATLSDFVIGNFPLCSLGAPLFAGLSKVGDPVTYPLTVTNTGAMPLYIPTVADTLLGNGVVN